MIEGLKNCVKLCVKVGATLIVGELAEKECLVCVMRHTPTLPGLTLPLNHLESSQLRGTYNTALVRSRSS